VKEWEFTGYLGRNSLFVKGLQRIVTTAKMHQNKIEIHFKFGNLLRITACSDVPTSLNFFTYNNQAAYFV